MGTVGTGFERQNDIDWVRILAVLLLIPFHTSRIFDTLEPFYVKNPELSAWLTYVVVIFLSKWQMPLLFLLAGASTWYALNKRSGGQYAVERLKRLLVPFVFGTLVIVPPQMYFALMHRDGASVSYLGYYPTFFRLRPTGMPDYTGVGFSWAHLWFILNLLVIALVALPLFLGLKTKAGERMTRGFASFMTKGPAILLFALPFPFVLYLLPEVDGKPVFMHLMVFIFGFVLISDAGYRRALERNRWVALILAIVCTAIDYTLMLKGVKFEELSLGFILLGFAQSFAIWFWIAAILGFGRRHLNIDNWVLRYAREAAYPFYLIHQTVIVALGFYVVRLNTAVLQKFLVIAVGSLVLTVGLYDLVVRRTLVTRFLFGMRAKVIKASSGMGAQ